jgi:hypothetical protein
MHCKYCKYTTKDRRNYIKHCKTKKHKRNIETYKTGPKLNQVLPEFNQKNKKSTQQKSTSGYNCKFCTTDFTTLGSLKRHGTRCVLQKLHEKDIELLNKEKELQSFKKEKEIEIDMIKKENAYNEKELRQKTEFIHYYKQLLELTDNKIKDPNVSAFNYIVTNYTKAVPLKRITYKDYKKAKNFKYSGKLPHDEQILEDLFVSYKHKKLHKDIGNIIIKLYRNTDPTMQSLWSTDESRMKYIVRKNVGHDDYRWEADNRGTYTAKHIIDPLIDTINKLISIWVNKHCKDEDEDDDDNDENDKNSENCKNGKNENDDDKKNIGSEDEFVCTSDEDYISTDTDSNVNPFQTDLDDYNYKKKVTNYIGILTELKSDIEKKWVQRKILRYISPYFAIDKRTINNN